MLKSFQQNQIQLADAIRQSDGGNTDAHMGKGPLAVYQQLFFNNVDSFVRSAFPVICSLYDEESWQKMVRMYFCQHRFSSPYFKDISTQFVYFLENEYQGQQSDPAYLAELAHYEWIELEVAFRACPAPIPYTCGQSVRQLSLSPLAEVLEYHYPVHTISVDNIAPKPEQVYLSVHRNEHGEVKFTELNGLTAAVLQYIAQQGAITPEALYQTLFNEVDKREQSNYKKHLDHLIESLLTEQLLVPASID